MTAFALFFSTKMFVLLCRFKERLMSNESRTQFNNSLPVIYPCPLSRQTNHILSLQHGRRKIHRTSDRQPSRACFDHFLSRESKTTLHVFLC